MLTNRLLSSSLAAQGSARAAAAALRRLGTGRSSAADDFATGAAGVCEACESAGGKLPGDVEGQMKIHHALSEVPEPDPDLPPIGGYGDDPVAALSDAASGAGEAVAGAVAGAASAASEAAGSVAGAGRRMEGARETMSSAKESDTPHSARSQAVHSGGNPTAGEAPGSSGTAMPGATRWKKEADDAMQGGAPEPGVVLEVLLSLLTLGVLLPAPHARWLPAAPSPVEQTDSAPRWAVVLDAGSTGTRVAVFQFGGADQPANISSVQLQRFEEASVNPGLSSHAGKPQEAAASLQPLLDKALTTVPAADQPNTKIMLGATAGLRFLPKEQQDEILAAVRQYLRQSTPFQVDDPWVSVLSGQAEGAYGWGQANYLLGQLGLDPSETFAVLDMGGGSMQETYALLPGEAAGAPANVTQLLQVNGASTLPDYDLYSYSYLGFGSKAARAAVLEAGVPGKSSDSACLPLGANGTYKYDGKAYELRPLAGGPEAASCAVSIVQALEPFAPCPGSQNDTCTFKGIWGGNHVPDKVVLISSFWWTALGGGLVPENATGVELTPRDYGALADLACDTPMENYPETFPLLDSASYPYFCLDASFVHTVLTAGFKFSEDQPLQVLNSVTYSDAGRDQEVQMSWTLGAALSMLLGYNATNPAGIPV